MSPFVGRESDMDQLELLARRVFSERRPWLLTIVAPPGTGKSRLVHEFIGRLQDLSPDAVVAVANCLPALSGNRVLYRDGAPVAALVGGEIQWYERLEGGDIATAEAMLIQRRIDSPLLAYLR